MSVKMSGEYIGNFNVKINHLDSNSSIITTAPKDNAGDGSSFSPTDLIGAALGSCIITTIAIVAQKKGIKVERMNFTVEKHMSADTPRRISELPVEIHMPRELTSEERSRLEAAAHICPVHKSLKEEIKADIIFKYDL